ncbi:hypothetical protein LHFGNBLO_006577 (plasmid) [Mesorhizobium sp. AR10]|uniref:hypothetical protein n=1 Tax=Mesorhizobium sp. AR10 TaxID=2865839 RepID=UPI00216104E0|nr:hypothetical protein [Mesorhizobium sp. AR10]UVK35714.1 hypothetical protein LHFGNBLO_006577 [Mesorhizobium sp. AR10]
MPRVHGRKEREILAFLHEHVFDPILASPITSDSLRRGINYTIMRLNERDARGMVQYYWSAIVGTDPSIAFAAKLRQEGFDRFEEAIDQFRVLFDDAFLRRP